jgi:hypothetical protein
LPACLLMVVCCFPLQLPGSAKVPASAASADFPGQRTISLAGSWRFALDPEDVGVAQRWFARSVHDTVRLPGTTDTNHKGIEKDEQATDRLSRVWFWKGPAWYQREVVIPGSWEGKRITLFLERTKHTRVWIDEAFCGWDDTLSAPHCFDVTDTMTPGSHSITLVIDNARLPPVGPSHAVDERTQTNWNGIVGRMELRATDRVWFEDVQIYPDAAKQEAQVRAVIGNLTGKQAVGQITVGCVSYNVDQPATFEEQSFKVVASGRTNVVEFTYKPGEEVPLWDEFHPALLRLDLRLKAVSEDRSFADRRLITFGMRDFKRDGNRLTINGKRVFLRGRTDCANYPLTGYPPMDKAGWRRVLSTIKAWGLNHCRFHSWCPPRAAFEAADELGVYLQAELPNKRSGFRTPENPEAAIHNIDRLDLASSETKVSLYDYGKREGELIFRHFGNHPSFVMFTLGNELGRNPAMFEMVAHFKEIDPRHLYAQGANNMHWNPSLAQGDDFWVTGKVKKDSLPLRGSFSVLDFPNAAIETLPPSTMFDFRESITGMPVPMVGHETGQFQVSPDYRDISKFTGILRARNYEIFRERLTEAGMLDQAHDFVRASGSLSAICYREDIEMALRTPGMAGFQLLDIQDFPGQGTALVGMLNVFMESKGVIEPEAWRQFCSETVPLLRMKKYTWTTEEVFNGRVQIAHYGPDDLTEARVTWTATYGDGVLAPTGAFAPVTIKQGKINEIDRLVIPLNDIVAPQKLTIIIAIEGTNYRNAYPIWVYPPRVDTSPPEGVLVTRSFATATSQKHLASGGKVLLLPELDQLPLSVEGGFQCEFWSPMFAVTARRRGVKPSPGTLGILCNPDSPALAAFPTEFHTNWQWWHLVKNSRPLIMDGTSEDYRPIVQVIDNFVTNHKLGLITETRLGNGAMLICTIDLLGHQDRPEARQMLYSLLRYLDSPAFGPEVELNSDLLKSLLPGSGK